MLLWCPIFRLREKIFAVSFNFVNNFFLSNQLICDMHLSMIFEGANLLNATQYQYLIAPPVLIINFASRAVQRARAQFLVNNFEFSELETHSWAVFANLTGTGATFKAIFGELLFSENRNVLAIEKKLGDWEWWVYSELFIFSESFYQFCWHSILKNQPLLVIHELLDFRKLQESTVIARTSEHQLLQRV